MKRGRLVRRIKKTGHQRTSMYHISRAESFVAQSCTGSFLAFCCLSARLWETQGLLVNVLVRTCSDQPASAAGWLICDPYATQKAQRGVVDIGFVSSMSYGCTGFWLGARVWPGLDVWFAELQRLTLALVSSFVVVCSNGRKSANVSPRFCIGGGAIWWLYLLETYALT